MWSLNEYELDKKPLYQKIMSLIESHIQSGRLNKGALLPSERRLASLLTVNRSTVIRALDELTANGILIRKIGSGTYVNPDKWGLQAHSLINWQSNVLSYQFDNPSLYLKKVAIHKANNHVLRKTGVDQSILMDLSNGDLPLDLLPTLKTPDISWAQLIAQEHSALTDNPYDHQLGVLSLRYSVQAHLKISYQLDVPLEEILITSGTQQALFLITQGLLKPGDLIAIESPSYFYSLRLFQAAGLKIIPIQTDNQGVTLEGLNAVCLKYPIKMIFLNPIFQNPTGAVMQAERKKSILDYCYLRRIPLVEDDAYGNLTFNPLMDASPIKKMDTAHQVLYLGSLSKYVGQNIRIGWMVGPANMVRKLAEIRAHIDSGLSIFPQILAEHFLRHDMLTHHLHLRTQLLKRATALVKWLHAEFGSDICFNPPQGGFHLYANIAPFSPDKLQKANKNNVNDILSHLLLHNIIVAEGRSFGDTEHNIRFSFGHFKL